MLDCMGVCPSCGEKSWSSAAECQNPNCSSQALKANAVTAVYSNLQSVALLCPCCHQSIQVSVGVVPWVRVVRGEGPEEER